MVGMDDDLATEKVSKKEQRAQTVRAVKDWLDRKIMVGGISDEGARVVEELLEDLR